MRLLNTMSRMGSHPFENFFGCLFARALLALSANFQTSLAGFYASSGGFPLNASLYLSLVSGDSERILRRRFLIAPQLLQGQCQLLPQKAFSVGVAQRG